MYEAKNIMSCEDITAFCNEIQNFLSAEYNSDIPQAVIERATIIEGYMALTGKMVADSEYNYNDVLNSKFIQAVREGHKESMSPSVMGKYIDSLCKDYKYLLTWCQRLNSSCVHDLDFARSLISKHKAELIANQYSG